MARRAHSLSSLVVLLGCVSLPAQGAVRTSIGLGMDYWLTNQGLFHVDLSVGAPLSKHFVVGGRVGALVSTSPVVGVPIDAELRFLVSKFYADLLVGPWILFEPFPFRIHAAAGLGYQSGWFSIGLEAGWLHPAAHLGLRIGFHF